MRKNHFNCIYCSSEDFDHSFNNLFNSSQYGWISKQNPKYPINVVIDLKGDFIFNEMHIVSHESMIATRIDISISNNANLNGVEINRDNFYEYKNQFNWKNAGFFCFSSNERSNWVAREFKKVALQGIQASYIMLSISECYKNIPGNAFNQVSIISLNFIGIYLYRPRFGSSLIEMYDDLLKAKKTAIQVENFAQADLINIQIENAKRNQDALNGLFQKKQIALENEEFLTVESIVNQIFSILNQPIKNQQQSQNQQQKCQQITQVQAIQNADDQNSQLFKTAQASNYQIQETQNVLNDEKDSNAKTKNNNEKDKVEEEDDKDDKIEEEEEENSNTEKDEEITSKKQEVAKKGENIAKKSPLRSPKDNENKEEKDDDNKKKTSGEKKKMPTKKKSMKSTKNKDEEEEEEDDKEDEEENQNEDDDNEEDEDNKESDNEDNEEEEKKETKKSSKKQTKPTTPKSPKSPKSSSGTAHKNSDIDEQKNNVIDPLTDEAIRESEYLIEQFGEETVAMVYSENWEVKSNGLASLCEKIKNLNDKKSQNSALTSMFPVIHKMFSSNLKATYVQAVNQTVSLIDELNENGAFSGENGFPRKMIRQLMNFALVKLSNTNTHINTASMKFVKWTSKVDKVLMMDVAQFALKPPQKQSTPILDLNKLDLLDSLFKDEENSLASKLAIKDVIQFFLKCMQSPNKDVRTMSIKFYVTCYENYGKKVAKYIEELPKTIKNELVAATQGKS